MKKIIKKNSNVLRNCSFAMERITIITYATKSNLIVDAMVIGMSKKRFFAMSPINCKTIAIKYPEAQATPSFWSEIN